MRNKLPLVLALLIGASVAAQAQEEPMVPGQIRAVKVQGDVWQVIKANGQKERLKEGDFFRQGNMIETTANGSAVLLFENGSAIDLRPNTKFSIDEFLVEPFNRDKVDYRRLRSEPSVSVTGVHVKQGTITAKVAKLNRASSYNITTPLGTAGIRGTVVTVSVTPQAATFVVSEGMIQVTKGGQTYWASSGAGQGNQQGDTRTGREGSQQDETLIIADDPNYTPPQGQVQNLTQQGQQFSQTAGQMIPDQAFSGAPADAGGGGGGGGGGGSGGGAPPAMPGGFGGGGGGGSGGGTSGGGGIYSK